MSIDVSIHNVEAFKAQLELFAGFSTVCLSAVGEGQEVVLVCYLSGKEHAFHAKTICDAINAVEQEVSEAKHRVSVDEEDGA